MHYHVMIWPSSTEQQMLGELFATNLTEEQLRERFISPYETGDAITWNGRTLAGGDVSYLKVASSEDPIHVQRFRVYDDIFAAADDPGTATIRDVTNEWITGAPGQPLSSAPVPTSHAQPATNPRLVMVVYGRNIAARQAVFLFLRALGLIPIEWEQAVARTGRGSPHNLEAVTAAMSGAQAVVVILTGEDQGGLLPALADGDDADVLLRGQPRQNVILEAGLAMGLAASRTILVELGQIRRASDFDGLNTVRLGNEVESRDALRSRLESAGCAIEAHGQDWLNPATAGDFENCLVPWSEESPPQLGNNPSAD